MNLKLLLGYKDIYGEPKESLSDLVGSIDLRWAAQFISNVNCDVFFNEKNFNVQQFYLKYLNEKWDKTQIATLYSKIIRRQEGEIDINDVFFFSRHSLMYLFYEILKKSHKCSKEMNHPTQIEKENFFKAVLVANDIINERTSVVGKDITNQKDLMGIKWSTFNLQNQLESSDPIIKMLKAKCFFDFLENDPNYTSSVKEYLDYYKSKDSWTLLIEKRMNPFLVAVKKSQDSIFNNFAFTKNQTDDRIIRNMTLNIDKSPPKAFSLKIFKQTPLFEISPSSFVVIDWALYLEQLFEAIIFDFFELTKVREIGQFKDFIAFRNKLIDTKFYEDYLLTKIIHVLFPKKFQIVLSENEMNDNREKSLPDFYIRDQNNIFLFEFKNSSYKSTIDGTSDSEEILKLIDQKFNTNEVGVGQQLKRLEYLKENNYEKSTGDLYPKNNKLSIFSIIIFSDYNFDIPAVGRYLNESFESQIDSELRGTFKNIYPLLFIHIDYFFEYIDFFSKDSKLFKNHIDRFIKYQKGIDKKRRKGNQTFVSNEKLDLPFTYRIRSLYNYSHNRNGFVKSAFDAFDLLQNIK